MFLLFHKWFNFVCLKLNILMKCYCSPGSGGGEFEFLVLAHKVWVQPAVPVSSEEGNFKLCKDEMDREVLKQGTWKSAKIKWTQRAQFWRRELQTLQRWKDGQRTELNLKLKWTERVDEGNLKLCKDEKMDIEGTVLKKGTWNWNGQRGHQRWNGQRGHSVLNDANEMKNGQRGHLQRKPWLLLHCSQSLKS